MYSVKVCYPNFMYSILFDINYVICYRYAKFTEKGIYFRRDNSNISYVVDCSGVKTSYANLNNLEDDDITIPTFLSNARYGEHLCNELIKFMKKSSCHINDGMVTYAIGNIRCNFQRNGVLR